MTERKIIPASEVMARRGALAALELRDVQAAEDRILQYLRYTPLLQTWLARDDGARIKACLKLENLQVTGAFVARGLLNAALSLPFAEIQTGLVGYGVLHGSAVGWVANVLAIPAVIYLYDPTPTDVVDELEQLGARVVVASKTNAEARQQASEHADRDGMTFIVPSASRPFIAGCATIALEVLEMAPEIDVLVTSVGFGPLLAGVAIAVKQMKPAVRVIGVDRSLRPGKEASLASAGHAPPSRMAVGGILQNAASLSRALIERFADDVVLVTDAETSAAARMLWSEMEVRTGILGASAVAAIRTGRVQLAPTDRLAAIIGSAGGEGLF